MNHTLKFTIFCFCIIAGIASCKRELQNISSPVTSRTVSDYHAIANGQTFGVLINPGYNDTTPNYATDPLRILNLNQKVNLAKEYGVNYIRIAITHDNWVDPTNSYAKRTNFLTNFKTFYDTGFSILLNVNYYNQDTAASPPLFIDSASYHTFLKGVLDSLIAREAGMKPALLVVENEEFNAGYYHIAASSDVTRYVNLLKVAINECGSRSIQVTNGGFTSGIATFLTWDWLKSQYDTATANSWARKVLCPTVADSLIAGSFFNQIALAKYAVLQYTPLSLNYINLHWYEPAKTRNWDNSLSSPYAAPYNISKDSITKGAIDSCVRYFAVKLTPPLISNELGQITYSAKLNNNIITKFLSYQPSKFSIISWYDGDDDRDIQGAKALHNTTSSSSYTLRASGTNFKTRLH